MKIRSWIELMLCLFFVSKINRAAGFAPFASSLSLSPLQIYNNNFNVNNGAINARSYTRATPLFMSEKKLKKPLLRRKPKPDGTTTGAKTVENPRGRPFTLPSGLFRPKQSLGQNFLRDQNYVLKICDAFQEHSEDGCRVVEIGPGPGSLSRVLVRRYPKMTAIEIDQRAVALLKSQVPELTVLHMDVLDFDWPQLAFEKGGPVSVIANLPYYIVSQVLFSLADSHKAISRAVVTTQLEVAQRITAKPKCKEYGIPSVILQLYGTTSMNFKIPPTVFYPIPNVDSALVTIDFTKPHPELYKVNLDQLRKVITTSFQQRRKMLRRSLKGMLEAEGLTINEEWGKLRPEALTPGEFITLTEHLYGSLSKNDTSDANQFQYREEGIVGEEGEIVTEPQDKSFYTSKAVWRTSLFGHKKKNLSQLEGFNALSSEGGREEDSDDDE